MPSRRPGPVRRVLALVLGSALALLAAAPVAAAAPPGRPVVRQQQRGPFFLRLPPRVPTRDELPVILDDLVARANAQHPVPGAVVVVVKDGEVVLARGYGVADVAAKTPVDPAATLFRIGSLTKVFTALAVAQLEHDGRLSLDDPVNRHLAGWQLEPSFPSPVRIVDLLTHTAGFDEKLLRTAGPPEPLVPYLQRELPPRVRPPGRIIAYSNFGYTLLGAVVEQASGEPFDRYLRERVILPLGMYSTWSDLPDTGGLAQGYVEHLGHWRAIAPAPLRIGPAAGMTSTATDMARFMNALLVPDDASAAIPPRVRERLFERRFVQSTGLPGITAAGLFESRFNRLRGVYHRGGVLGFASLMFLDPDSRFGVFIANNGDDQGFGWAVVDPLLRRWFGPAATEVRPARNLASRVAPVAGRYRAVRFTASSLEKLALWRTRDLDVAVTPDGFLRIGGRRYQELAPLVFEQVGGWDRAAFLTDPAGRVTHLAIDQDVFERLPPTRQMSFHQWWLVLELIVLASALFGFGGGPPTLIASLGKARGEVRWPILTVRWLCGLDIAFVALLVLAFTTAGPGAIWFGVPPAVRAVLVLPLVTTAACAVLPIALWFAWRDPAWSVGRRLHLSVVCLALVGFVVLQAAWNVLGVSW